MINYEKLRLAHELAEKLDCICECKIYLNGKYTNLFKISYEPDSEGIYHRHESFTVIDDLITKLEELEQQVPPYYTKFEGPIEGFRDGLEKRFISIESKVIGLSTRIDAMKSIIIKEKECRHPNKINGLGNDFICKECDEYVVPGECSENIHTESKPRSNAARVCDNIYQQLKDADFPKTSSGKYETCTFELKPKECQHEWDGIRISREKEFNRMWCKHCDNSWDEPKECKHESDGYAYSIDGLPWLTGPVLIKCKKCGEFYR